MSKRAHLPGKGKNVVLSDIAAPVGLLLLIAAFFALHMLFLAHSKNELMQLRGVRRLSVRPSVRLSVNFCANRFFSQTNGRIATKLAHDGLWVSVHPGCAQGQGQRSRDARTFLDSWNERTPSLTVWLTLRLDAAHLVVLFCSSYRFHSSSLGTSNIGRDIW